MLTTIALDDPRGRDASLVGGKAARISSMRQLGFPVPDGVCLRVRPENLSAVPSYHLEGAVASLQPPWAVRSSAATEDGERQSHAGIYATVLSVASIEDLLPAVKAVLASYTGPRARAYANPTDVAIVPPGASTVLVQTMVRSKAGGVAFSCDPVTGEAATIVEATTGFADSVVNGSTQPDYFRVAGSTILEARLGWRPDRPAGEEADKARLRAYSVSTDELRRIVALCTDCARVLGRHVDVEWSIDDTAKLWLLQVRPLTTLNTNR